MFSSHNVLTMDVFAVELSVEVKVTHWRCECELCIESLVFEMASGKLNSLLFSINIDLENYL